MAPVKFMRKTLIGRLAGEDLSPEERRRLIGTLFFSGKKDRLTRFWILLFLSLVIATFGLLTNSTAVVIGAMLLAPLMTPTMGVAASLIMVWPRRLSGTGLLLLVASVFCVGVSWLIADLVPGILFQTLPDEVLSRTSPGLADLLIAVAAGAAGAFATVREDVSAALPGVAIAVALLPPLGSVGVTLAFGDYDLAAGAALLYLTNIAGIILSASLVFLSTGFVPYKRVLQLGRKVWAGLIIALVSVILVSLPLYEGLARTVRSAQVSASVDKVINNWLAGGPFEVNDVSIKSDSIEVTLVGLEDPPEVSDLASALEEDLGRPIDVSVVWFRGEARSDLRYTNSGEADDGLTPIPGI